MADRLAIAREMYRAFAAGDRGTVERTFSPELLFHAPPDPRLDREGYFERCWPGAGQGQRFDFTRLEEIGGDAVLVTYEATRADGSRFRNTEVITFDGDRIAEVEVYFGWDLEP